MPDLRIDPEALRTLGATSHDVGLKVEAATQQVESSLVRLAGDIGNSTVADELESLLKTVQSVHPQVVSALAVIGAELAKAADGVEATDADLAGNASNPGLIR